MKGIDVSNYQGNIDFAKVKASGIQIVYIKATEGKTYQDPMFKTNYTNAKANGLLVGAYHFLHGNSVQDEVNNFLSVVGNLDFDCKYMIDAETDLGSVEANSKQTLDFYNALKTLGMDAVLYTGEYFYNGKLNSTVKNIPLWVAKYSTVKPNVSYIGWQYSSSGVVYGINGRVDIDDFTEEILIKGGSDMNKIVTYLGDADVFAALIVSQKLNCPLMLNADYVASGLKADQVIQIGGKPNSTRFSTFKDAANLL